MNRQQRAIAAAVLTPQVKSTTEKERKSNSFHRLFPLLLLTLYALASVVRLAFSSPFPSSFVQTSASSSSTFSAESRQESESLKTHVPSETHRLEAYEENPVAAAAPPCSSFIDGTAESRDEAAAAFVCCDRSHIRSDLCYARGDIRTDSASSSVLVYGMKSSAERVRPYTRKWDAAITRTIQEISIRPGNDSGGSPRRCDVRHEGVPALLFSNGGYTGNLYHEFSDGLIPLYVTAQRFRGEVVLVVAEYRPWWMARYRPLLERLTNYQIVDFSRDRRAHCFSEMIVGLRIHGELIIDPWLMPNGNGIRDFQALVHEGYDAVAQSRPSLPAAESPPFLRPLVQSTRREPPGRCSRGRRPRIAVFVRKGCRALVNQRELVRACQRTGFDVQIIEPKRDTPLDVIHRALVPADVMLAVHGAAVTHFLFMRPSSVLIQVVPLGLEKPAEEFYGEPARRLGMEYVAYNITPEESTLLKLYDRRSPVLVNTNLITNRGWLEMKKIYLDKQNVKLNLTRFGKLLAKTYSHVCGARGIE
ncbi:xylan glycosyltransferase MUCI21-like [Zingiber officinale]|uniref:Glycosyltransferase 61 catalytic domain-containing protein n=1 Tax=Zingiber officinale TaxID=94328 RepID=A0A8J5FFW1_ZINOF|nr:xylan glycosyltransferase MUCI21-like [Zingiber officinale]KAG6488742.1 hypothetical protein ZIOFF_049991 [Zingiber officinale]